MSSTSFGIFPLTTLLLYVIMHILYIMYVIIIELCKFLCLHAKNCKCLQYRSGNGKYVELLGVMGSPAFAFNELFCRGGGHNYVKPSWLQRGPPISSFKSGETLVAFDFVCLQNCRTHTEHENTPRETPTPTNGLCFALSLSNSLSRYCSLSMSHWHLLTKHSSLCLCVWGCGCVGVCYHVRCAAACVCVCRSVSVSFCVAFYNERRAEICSH